MDKYKIVLVDAGDSAVSIRFPQEISPKINREVIFYHHCILDGIGTGKLHGVLDVIPSYSAILVVFDLSITDGEIIKDSLQDILEESLNRSVSSDSSKHIVEIPVLYGGEYGPDLETVSTHSGLSPEDIIAIHTAPEYPVYMIGFLAGFPYLGGMDSRIATPRLDSPRLSVPEGSVGIADRQTGIYPVETPGGWQIIGRTPLKLYNPYGENPFLVSPGDSIKFISVTEEEYSKLRHSLTETSSEKSPALESHTENEPALRFLSSGPLTTIQDLGRHGYMDKGLAVCGAMDTESLKELNLMVGNSIGSAGLESTFITPRIEFLRDTVFAMSGINFPILAKAGEILESITMKKGIRTYFAFKGGIAVMPVLGSRSTDIKNMIGGLNRGSKIKAGDELCLGKCEDQTECVSLSEININDLLNKSCGSESAESPIQIYVTPGPHFMDLSQEGIDIFFNSEYIVSTSSDRMGIRFDGPTLSFTEGKNGNIITDGVSPGAIQITPSGQPILMNADCQTTGGYSKPFWLASISKRKIAQLRPGERVKFVFLKTDEAARLFRQTF